MLSCYTDAVPDFLYGVPDGSDLKESFDTEGHYCTLLSWTNAQWNALLRK